MKNNNESDSLPKEMQDTLRRRFSIDPLSKDLQITHTQCLVDGYSRQIQDEGDHMNPTDKEIIVDIIKKAQMKISFIQSLQNSDTQSPQTAPDKSPLDQFRS